MELQYKMGHSFLAPKHSRSSKPQKTDTQDGFLSQIMSQRNKR